MLRRFIGEFTVTFTSAVIAGAGATYLYSLLIHKDGHVDWHTTLVLAVLLGIALPVSRRVGKTDRRK